MKPFFFLLLFFPSLVFAQFSDSFNQSDLSQDTLWTGTLQRFKINTAHQLQLNDSVAGTAWLFAPLKIEPATEWDFWVKTAFSPSSKNFIRLYLMTDFAAPDSLTKGYYLQLGEKGSADALELFRFTHDTAVSVCRGPNGQLSHPFALHLKVLRDSTGNWQIWSDSTGKGDFLKKAEGKDNRFAGGRYFGLYCQYTKSYAKKIWFDDVYAGPLRTDTLPPHADSVLVINDTTLAVFFNERLDTLTAKDTSHYRVIPSAGKLKRIIISRNACEVRLVFSTPFRHRQMYLLSLSGIKDIAGNSMAEQKLSFVFVSLRPFDVVINEIMADPTPSVGLPEYEYLELFNRTSVDLDLSGWTLLLGKTQRVFGKVVIPAKGYLILCKNQAVADFSPFGNVYGFGSFSLTNTGEQLQLLDPEGKIISSVRYDKSWYDNQDKAKGGWSLEQVNPENYCSGRKNWKVSVNSRGGTPGKQNSVFDTLLLRPKVTGLQVVSPRILQLFFSQKMNIPDLVSNHLYAISPEKYEVDSAAAGGDLQSVKLFLSAPIDTASVDQLTVSEKMKNCAGTSMGADTALRFGIPQIARKNDVVINEVLFYPLEGGADYVELYNRSHKVIDVSTLLLGTVKKHPPNPPDSLFYDLCYQQKLFFPGDYLLLTSSPQKVKAQYHTENPQAFFQVTPFPAFNKEEGSVLLFRQLHKIDAFDYSEKMQYPLLNYTQGVALERVSVDAPTNNPDNWHSAAESVGFGTPGYRNSQSVGIKADSLSGEITVSPEIFSPDNDGYQDILHILCHFSSPGNTVTMMVFNAAGQPVRHLVNNAWAGTSAVFSWDGLQDDGTKAPVGIYVLYVQVFNPKGHVQRWKKTVVLATKL